MAVAICQRKSSLAEKHGRSKTIEYSAWVSMKQRCYNPKNTFYYAYGGRGVSVCDRWKDSFEAFYEDIGPKPSKAHSLDRIDVNGDYEPINCRWATAIEQLSNQRRNILVQYQGEKLTVSEAGRRSGLPDKIVHNRIKSGWSAEDAVTKPVWKPGKPRNGYKHRSNGIYVELDGEQMLLRQACSRLGLHYENVRRSIRRSKSTPQEAFDIISKR